MKAPKLIIAIILALVLASWQGARVSELRESETFYRWVVAAANQLRVFGTLEPGQAAREATAPDYMDESLFTDVEAHFEPRLNVEPGGEDADEESYSALIRAVQQGGHEHEIWRLASSAESRDLRQRFHELRREGRLASLGEVFEVGDLYANEGTLVNLGNMFLGFRQMAANLIWLEVDKYWHQGIMHRMIPLMYTTVTLDPNFVDAFLLGGWHMAYNITAPMADTPPALMEYDERYDAWVGEKERFYYRAADFLKDGIRKNPTDYRLYFDLGFSIYMEKIDDPTSAVRYLSEAVRYPHESWVRRTYYRALQDDGQYERSLQGWESYLEEFPDNQVAPRFIAINEGLIAERDGEAAYAAAREAEAEGDDERAAELRAEAEAHFDEARAVWENILLYYDDGYARTRVLRLDALELAEAGQYYEAVALLENARWESSDFFQEASEMIIEIKLEGGLPLSLSERQYLLRQQEGEQRRRANEADGA